MEPVKASSSCLQRDRPGMSNATAASAARIYHDIGSRRLYWLFLDLLLSRDGFCSQGGRGASLLML